MTLFWGLAAALLVLAMWMLLPALARRRGAATDSQAGRGNLAILREQLAQLDAELASGSLAADAHRLARGEIERRVLEEESTAEAPATVTRAPTTAWVLGLLLPAAAVGLYAVIGNPQAVIAARDAAASAQEGGPTQQQVEAMVEQLAKRLESSPGGPDDAKGWELLARSYSAMQRFPDANKAYTRAIALAPANTPQVGQLLADQADVLAMMQNQSLAGEPTRLVEKALQLDPKNPKALALAGSGAFERKDYAAAVRYWEQARPLAPEGSEFAAGLDRSLAEARTAATAGGQSIPSAAGAGGQSVPPAAAAPASATALASTAAPASGSEAAALGLSKISGSVRLAAGMATRVSPDDTVFIFARAAQGPRMPLAILKRKAGELPIEFTLDDSMAMSPALKLSSFASVVVGARVSKSGQALPQTGDLVGQASPSASGGKLEIVIDGVQP